MIRTTYTEVVKSNFDAGIYRQFLESNYAQTFAYGFSSGDTMKRAEHHAKVLSKLAGIPLADVIASAVAAAENEE